MGVGVSCWVLWGCHSGRTPDPRWAHLGMGAVAALVHPDPVPIWTRMCGEERRKINNAAHQHLQSKREFQQLPCHLAGTLICKLALFTESSCPLNHRFFFPLCRWSESSCVSLSGTPVYCMSPSILGVGFPPLLCLHLSICCFFCGLLHCAEAVHSALGSLSGGIALYVGLDLVCMWEGFSSGSSCGAIMDLPHIKRTAFFYRRACDWTDN